MRGNDPDAALYWLASMIAAGEDPTFVARRIVIAASEEVGNADPRALSLAVAAMQATEMIGLPEAQYALAQAAAYVASAPKSNRAGAAYFAALAEVEENGRQPVPLHLRPSAHRRLAREHGYGRGYLYPHDYDDADVDQQYLPDDARRAGLLRAVGGGTGAEDRGAAPAAPPAAPGGAGAPTDRDGDQRRRG